MNALIIIDMQHAYFMDKQLKKQQSQLITNIEKQIRSYSSKKLPIINVITVHSKDKSTWTLNMLEDNQGFLFDGSSETSTVLKLPDSVITIYKTRDSAFHETDLLSILRSLGVNSISLTGVSAHTCIFHTAVSAYAYNIDVTLLKDCIGDENSDAMKQSFSYLKKEYRQTII